MWYWVFVTNYLGSFIELYWNDILVHDSFFLSIKAKYKRPYGYFSDLIEASTVSIDTGVSDVLLGVTREFYIENWCWLFLISPDRMSINSHLSVWMCHWEMPMIPRPTNPSERKNTTLPWVFAVTHFRWYVSWEFWVILFQRKHSLDLDWSMRLVVYISPSDVYLTMVLFWLCSRPG